jgi:hypothetical protein
MGTINYAFSVFTEKEEILTNLLSTARQQLLLVGTGDEIRRNRNYRKLSDKRLQRVDIGEITIANRTRRTSIKIRYLS